MMYVATNESDGQATFVFHIACVITQKTSVQSFISTKSKYCIVQYFSELQ